MSAGRPIASLPACGSRSTRAGNLARRAQGCVERHSEGVHVSHRVSHCQRATGQHAVLAPHDPVANLHRHRAERVRPVPEAGAGDRVGHEGDAIRRCGPREQDRVGRQVDAVDDHLHDHPGADQRRADDARIAVAERSHRVEQVRDGARAAVERDRCLCSGRVAVAARDRDAAGDELVDEVERAGQLRRERDEADRAGLEQAGQQRRIGIAAGGRPDASPGGATRGTGLRDARRGCAGRGGRPARCAARRRDRSPET